MSEKETFEVNFGSGTAYDLDAIRRRKEAFMPDGEHAWVISAIFGLDDPERSLDDMELGADNFIGVSEIRCLLCESRYTTDNRHHKCAQTPTAKGGWPEAYTHFIDCRICNDAEFRTSDYDDWQREIGSHLTRTGHQPRAYSSRTDSLEP